MLVPERAVQRLLSRSARWSSFCDIETIVTIQLTIMTMNCLGLPVPVPGLRRRLQALGHAIATSNTDIACLQEVGRWRHLPLLRRDEDAWPHAIAMTHPYAPKGGLVTLTRLPIEATSYSTFRERGRTMSLHATERYQSKGILHISMMVGAQEVVVFNTHLAANYSARWTYTNPYAKVERAQLHEIADVVRAVPADKLVVVAGDLNVPRGSWLYHEFLLTAGLHDPLAGSPAPTYRPLPGMPAGAVQALDHILVRMPDDRPLQLSAELCFGDPVIMAHGATGYLSDHLGVRLTLAWSDIPEHGIVLPGAMSDQPQTLSEH